MDARKSMYKGHDMLNIGRQSIYMGWPYFTHQHQKWRRFPYGAITTERGHQEDERTNDNQDNWGCQYASLQEVVKLADIRQNQGSSD